MTVKRPVIVIVSIDEELLEAVNEWRGERHLLSAERVFPKGKDGQNYGPLTSLQLMHKVIYWWNKATRDYDTPQKIIIICDNEDFLEEVRKKIIKTPNYTPKIFEFHLVAKAAVVAEKHPNRVGFFTLKTEGE